MVKRENTAGGGEGKGDRETGERGNGKIWIYNIGSNGSKGKGERRDKLNRGERKKNGDVYNGVYRGDIKEKGERGI